MMRRSLTYLGAIAAVSLIAAACQPSPPAPGTTVVHDTTVVTKVDTVSVAGPTQYDTTVIARVDTVPVTKYDTTIVQGPTKYDTTVVARADTVPMVKYDTTVVTRVDTKYDTTVVTKHDTTVLVRRDTLVTHDTTIVQGPTKYDTTVVTRTIPGPTQYDTTIVQGPTRYDTLKVAVHDTVVVLRPDTGHVAVVDTTHSTMLVYDPASVQCDTLLNVTAQRTQLPGGWPLSVRGDSVYIQNRGFLAPVDSTTRVYPVCLKQVFTIVAVPDRAPLPPARVPVVAPLIPSGYTDSEGRSVPLPSPASPVTTSASTFLPSKP